MRISGYATGDERVCLYVCMYVCLSAVLCTCISRTSRLFCALYLWQWLSPPLAALRYVMYFRFCDGVIFAHDGPCRNRQREKCVRRIGLVKVTHQGTAPDRTRSDVYESSVSYIKKNSRIIVAVFFLFLFSFSSTKSKRLNMFNFRRHVSRKSSDAAYLSNKQVVL